MKKVHFLIVSLITLIMVGTCIGCDAFDTKENHDRSERRVKKDKSEEEPLTYEQEKWLMFKEEAEASLRFNYAHLLELRAKMKREGASQEVYGKLDSLERKYEELDRRFENYNSKGLPNLDSYARQYKRDTKELTKALNFFKVR